MATHSSTHAWVIHGERSLAGYSPWSHKKIQQNNYTTTTKANHLLQPMQPASLGHSMPHTPTHQIKHWTKMKTLLLLRHQ